MEESIHEEVVQMRQEFEQRAQAKARERWDQRVAEHEQRSADDEA